jgi:superfamily I DNA/RNA helicase
MYELVEVHNRTDIAVKVRQNVTALITAESLICSQIAILGPNIKKSSSISSISEINKYRITESYTEWRNNDGIYYSTIRSFKGLEADVIILIDFEYRESESLDNTDNIFSFNDLYVAISRAKHQLILIASDSSIIKHLTIK